MLLDDWQVHLRARHISAATIDSYARVGCAFRSFLVTNGMPERAGDLTRDHLETYLAAMYERKPRNREGTVGPATVAKHYRSLEQRFGWSTDDGEDAPARRSRATHPDRHQC
jgi:hypothetical protein